MAQQQGVDIGVIIALIDSISKENAALISALGITNMTANVNGDGILFTMSDDTQYDIPLTNLPYLKTSNISDAINSTSTGTVASSKAINDLNNSVTIKLSDYISKTSMSDSLVSNTSTTVSTSKAAYDLDQNKISKTDISTTIVNNPLKVASASSVYAVDQKLGDYVLKANISNEIASNSTTNAASSNAVKLLKDDTATKYIPKANLTDSYTGSSVDLAFNQKGAKALKDLIVAGISGMSYSGKINDVSFDAIDTWAHGEVYKASEEITFSTATIPNNALIIFKTTSTVGQVLTLDDFDYFASQFDISHTTEEVDKATDMVLDSNFTQVGFVDIQNCELSVDAVTRTVSIKPKVPAIKTICYINSTRVEITAEKTVVFPDTTNKHIIIMSEAGALVSTLEYEFSDPTIMPICMIRWDSANQEINALFDYRVTNLKMDIPTRSYVYNQGVQYADGFSISDFGLGNSSLDSICQFSLTGGRIRQAEKIITYANNPTPTLSYENIFSPICNTKIYYMEGQTYKTTDVFNTPLFMGTSFPFYNKKTNSTYSLVEATSDKYIAMYIGVSTDMRPKESCIAIMGQGLYDSIDECKSSETLGLIEFGDLEYKQFRFLYRVIYHISEDYLNTYKSKLIEYLDIRDFSLLRTFSSDTRLSGGGTSLTKVELTASEYLTGARNTVYYLKTGCSGAEITLPNTGLTVQDKIQIIDVDGVLNLSSAVTINGTTATINSNSDSLVLDVKNSTVEFEWSGTTWVANLSGTLVQPIYDSTLILPSSTSNKASMNIPLGGSAPTNPSDGDVFVDGKELYFKRFGSYFNQPLTTPTGTLAQRNALVTSSLCIGYPFFQTDGVIGLYRYTLTTGWVYEGNSNWTSYTPQLSVSSGTIPTLGTGGSSVGIYSISGKTMKIKVSVSQTGSGVAGSGVYIFSIPSGYTIDITVCSVPSSIVVTTGNMTPSKVIPLGTGQLNVGQLVVVPLNSANVGLFMNDASNSGLVGSTLHNLATANRYYTFTAEIPLTSV